METIWEIEDATEVLLHRIKGKKSLNSHFGQNYLLGDIMLSSRQRPPKSQEQSMDGGGNKGRL